MTDPSDHADSTRSDHSDALASGSSLASARVEPLLFVGGGTMAQAIICGAMSRGALDPSRIVLVDPNPARRAVFSAIGLSTHESISSAVEALRRIESKPGDGQLLLAVKPQMLGAVATDLAPLIEGESRVVISILAGIRSDRIADTLGTSVAEDGDDNARGTKRESSLRVIRVMPNTPARIGQGMSAIAMGSGAQPGDDAFAHAIFAAVGEVVSIEESLMDAFTAVAGSGPAYVFYLAEAMSAAAVRLGFSREQAELIVRQTVAGAGNLMAASAAESSGTTDAMPTPAALRAAVTSKNGTTYAATTKMDELGVMEAIITAVRAARDRGRELADG